MKITGPRVGIAALIAGMMGVSARGDSAQPLPTPYPAARYGPMSARSPFAVASAPAASTAAPTPGFAANLYIDGVAQVDQTNYVVIKSRDPDKPAIFLAVGESAPDGMKVERIRWSDDTGKSTVDVTKNGERATLAFDEAQISKTPDQQQAPGQQVWIPGQPPPPLVRTWFRRGQPRPMARAAGE